MQLKLLLKSGKDIHRQFLNWRENLRKRVIQLSAQWNTLSRVRDLRQLMINLCWAKPFWWLRSIKKELHERLFCQKGNGYPTRGKSIKAVRPIRWMFQLPGYTKICIAKEGELILGLKEYTIPNQNF